MKDFDRKDQNPSFLSSYSVELNTDGVQPPGVSTVPSTNPNSGENELNTRLFSSDYHLTVTMTVTLVRRQVSILLGILNYQAVHYGVNFEMYLCLLHCMEILIGSKLKPVEIKDDWERKTVEVSQLIIRDLAGISLVPQIRTELSRDTRKLILDGHNLMTRDVYKSRVSIYRPERLLLVKTVPVDVKIERSGNSVRYSSYCKGYGEGTGTARRGRTPPSSELDGEEVSDWVLIEHLSEKELARETFLLAHFEWLKRFGRGDS